MHTFKVGNVIMLHHGDLSGDVLIRGTLDEDGMMRVPGSVLLGFVAQYVQVRRISWLENATDEEILGIPPRR